MYDHPRETSQVRVRKSLSAGQDYTQERATAIFFTRVPYLQICCRNLFDRQSHTNKYTRVLISLRAVLKEAELSYFCPENTQDVKL